MAAIGTNSEGVCGIYPYADGRLYGVVTDGVLDYEENKVSCIQSKAEYAELILRGVKVINSSIHNNSPLAEKEEDTKIAMNYFERTANSSKEIEWLTEQSEILADYFERLLSKGYDFVLVSAAGNDDKPTYVNNYRVITERGWDNKFHENRGIDARYNSFVNMIDPNKHPEIYNRIIVVGNIKEGFDISSTSMTGERVDIYAPGEYIYSILPGNGYGGSDSETKESGTSFAAPHVAGAAADVWSINNSLNGAEVKKIVCEAINSKSKKDSNGKYKYPVLDLEKAVNAAFETKTDSNYKNVKIINGSIMGFVADAEVENPEKSFISGAEITVFRVWNDAVYEVTPKDDKEDKERKTDKNGHFELNLPPGTYDLMISADGYEPQVVSDVNVESQ